MKTSLLFLCLVFIALGPQNLTAQTSKSIILINGVANEVLMDAEGNIQEVLRELPNYMNEYNNIPVEPSRSHQEWAIAADEGMDVHAATTDRQALERGANKILYFKSQKATLSDATMIKLADIADDHKRTGRLIMLNSFYNRKYADSKNIVSNRIEGCKDYLISLGVSSSNLVISPQAAQKETARIFVFLK